MTKNYTKITAAKWPCSPVKEMCKGTIFNYMGIGDCKVLETQMVKNTDNIHLVLLYVETPAKVLTVKGGLVDNPNNKYWVEYDPITRTTKMGTVIIPVFN